MNLNRRRFLKSTFGTAAAASLPAIACAGNTANVEYGPLDKVLAQPVLKTDYFNDAVIIESVELLRLHDNFIVRVRSKDGAVGHSVCNNAHMVYLYPIVIRKLIPFFAGKDATQLDSLIDEVYIDDSNYKLQGLALWISLASVEFAILDMLGRISEKAICELIGDIYNPRVAVYRANNYRGQTAEASIEKIKRNVEKTGSRALKIKIGGRMRKNLDIPPGRTEKLIPLAREAFGDDMTIYADSNGSYTVEKAVEIGRLLEKYKMDFYEEPVPFDWHEETKIVTDTLDIPIAGGEQETSMHAFRWLIGNNALDIVQPDMFYFGGMVRSMRVARMAQAVGKTCVPHISGSGLGHLYMVHFVAAIANAGPFHEFKGINPDIPFACETSSLKSENGVVTVPVAPGSGILLDPGFINKHKPVKA